MQISTALQPLPRKKSILWKCTFWLMFAVILSQFLWLISIPVLRQTLKLERATPRVNWLEWPSEIDLNAMPQDVMRDFSAGPYLLQPKLIALVSGEQLANLTLKTEIIWQDLPDVIEPWNIKLEMAVFLIEANRFLSTARGSMRPVYKSKKLTWQNSRRSEPVTLQADFLVPKGKKFYGYVLRLSYKDKPTCEFSDPTTVASFLPLKTASLH